jgi:hypothetical protein
MSEGTNSAAGTIVQAPLRRIQRKPRFQRRYRRVSPALVKESEGGIKNKKDRDNRSFDIFTKRQLKKDRDLEEDRNRRQKFTQHQAQRVDSDIGGRILAHPSSNAGGLSTGKTFYLFVHGFCRPSRSCSWLQRRRRDGGFLSSKLGGHHRV